MNTQNNLRYQKTEDAIRTVFFKLLKEREIRKISVSEICKLAKINRTSFYLHYTDIFDLVQKIETGMANEVLSIFISETGENLGDRFLRLFYYIRENKTFYQGYFCNYDKPSIINFLLPASVEHSTRQMSALIGVETEKELLYHQEFFKAGLTAIIKIWLSDGCRESPEELAAVIDKEYSPKKELFRDN